MDTINNRKNNTNDNTYNNQNLYNKRMFTNLSILIQDNIFKTSKWLKYDDIYIYNDVINILCKINEFYILDDYHYVITFIYFKRLLNIGGIHNKPFYLFLLSLILCIKYWSESNNVCNYSPIFIKNLFKYEFNILINSNFSFQITPNLFNDTYNLIFLKN